MTSEPDGAQLWLVRHAPVLLPPGTCYGQLDLPADLVATQRSAETLATRLPQGLHIISSTLQRCELLAQSLCALRPDLTLNFDARLREMDFGHWEGNLWNAIPRAEIDAWCDDLPYYAPGNGETLAAMLARVQGALKDAESISAQLELLPVKAAGAGNVVWISHAGVARCVQWLQGLGSQGRLPQADEWPLQAPTFGGWTQFPLRRHPDK